MEIIMKDLVIKNIQHGTNYHVEITEDYEGSKWHVVVFEETDDFPFEHFDTQGFETKKQVENYLKNLEVL